MCISADTKAINYLSCPIGAMAAGGEDVGKWLELARRKALLNEETTSTNAPRLVYPRPRRGGRERPTYQVDRFGKWTN